MKSKKINVNEKINIIEGFTKEFEKCLKAIKFDKDHRITEEELKNSLIYSFATLALSKNSPVQLINVVNTIKDIYGKRLTDNALGFLECMSAKSYGYLSFLTTNMENQKKFKKIAVDLFSKAYSRGYTQAISDLMDFKAKYTSLAPYQIEDIGLPHVKEDANIFYTLGNIFVDLSTLVSNADRALRNKRPVIEDMGYFENAEYKYSKGMEENSGCAVCYGLCLIIKGEKEKGLELVRNNIEGFKKEKGKVERILFESDANSFKESVENIQTKILNNNKR